MFHRDLLSALYAPTWFLLLTSWGLNMDLPELFCQLRGLREVPPNQL